MFDNYRDEIFFSYFLSRPVDVLGQEFEPKHAKKSPSSGGCWLCPQPTFEGSFLIKHLPLEYWRILLKALKFCFPSPKRCT